MCHASMNAIDKQPQYSGHSLAEVIWISTQLFSSTNKQWQQGHQEKQHFRAKCQDFAILAIPSGFIAVTKLWLGHAWIGSAQHMLF